jgi:predicted helicase
LKRKYEKELHANEIVLLAYYIASINIENAFHDAKNEDSALGKNTDYTPFTGICLTDTFQLGETEDQNRICPPALPLNYKRVQSQQKSPIQVIIGNPPYSVGQKSENDNAKNQPYPKLDKQIANTYVKLSNATLSKSVYDSYIKAFRWSSDRLDKTNGGIIAFVSNAGWIDGNAMDGFRKCLEKEFSAVYVFNLRGNQRTSDELSRREGGQIFGSGSRTPIAITVLVKKPNNTGKALIHYHDIGDYLSREGKLAIIAKDHDVFNPKMQWEILNSNKNGDWLNQRNDIFASFIPLADKNKSIKSVFKIYSAGIVTSRDSWCYNYSAVRLTANISNMIDFYNKQRISYHALNDADMPIDNFIETNPQKISWSVIVKRDLYKNSVYKFSEKNIRVCAYRPFTKQKIYYEKSLNERQYQIPKLFPTPEQKNLVICVSANKIEVPLLISSIPDFHFNGDSQCFPLYYYEENKHQQNTLLDIGKCSYIRKEGVTEFILERGHEKYGQKVTKEDIFYYVYGLLHSEDYRKQFSADLKKMLPCLPLVEKPADFWTFSKSGRALAELHLKYEDAPPCPDVIVSGADSGKFVVEKMRFISKGDKSTSQYNPYIKISGIPLAAYEYIVNGRSAIEWIMERYQIKTDKESGIKNDPNDWANEHNKPRYILDLLLSIITVSLETVKIVNGLPRLELKG